MLTTSHYIEESIPWRNKKQTKLEIGQIDYKGLKQHCFIVDELKWLGKLSPSFLVIVPNLKNLSTTNKGTNGIIVYPKPAQTELNYNSVASGTAHLYSYFFGREKPGRTFDLIYRMFEEGFSLENFKGFENNSILPLNKNSEISISTKGYKHPNIITGKTIDAKPINARLLRVK